VRAIDDATSVRSALELLRAGAYTNWWLLWKNRRDVAELAPLCTGELLDIGCGAKPYEALLRPYVTRYVGFDHPETQHARDAVDVWGTATDLPFADRSFDTVVAFQVLEHVEDPTAMTSEAFRVLRPGGVFIVTTPFMHGVHEAPRDFFRYTEHGLRHLLTTAGFCDVEINATSGAWMMLGLRLSYLLERYRSRRVRWIVIALQVLAQAIGAVLDRWSRVETDTVGYVTVARAPVALAHS
jgi:SAM-dependent methyltransferase